MAYVELIIKWCNSSSARSMCTEFELSAKFIKLSFGNGLSSGNELHSYITPFDDIDSKILNMFKSLIIKIKTFAVQENI